MVKIYGWHFSSCWSQQMYYQKLSKNVIFLFWKPKFTSDKEHDGKLQFLDTLVIRTDKKLVWFL